MGISIGLLFFTIVGLLPHLSLSFIVPEIAASGQKTPLLAMTVGGTCGLSGTVIANTSRSLSLRGPRKWPKQSLFAAPNSFVIASLRQQAWQSRFCVFPIHLGYRRLLRRFAPRNDIMGRASLSGAVLASTRRVRGNLIVRPSGTKDCRIGAKPLLVAMV